MEEGEGTKNSVLIIEDNLTDRILIKKYLSLGNLKSWSLVETTRLNEGILAIEEQCPDIILLDLSLPDASGVDGYNRLKRNSFGKPIIVLTGLSDLNLAKQLIKLGAQDYLVKGDFDHKLLEKAIDYAIERNKLKIETDFAKEKLVDSVLQAQDRERARIAKELHDGVVQSLTAVSLNLGLLGVYKETFDDKTRSHYEKCTLNLTNTIEEIRNISHSLMPRVINDLGLVNAIEAFVSDMSEVSTINYEFFSNLKCEVSEKMKISVYRIVQELINNVQKHSKAKNVMIQLLEHDETIDLMVEDDGLGFDKPKIEDEKNCFGLNSIESRASSIGATLEIDTKPGNGTNVFVAFPKKFLV